MDNGVSFVSCLKSDQAKIYRKCTLYRYPWDKYHTTPLHPLLIAPCDVVFATNPTK